MLFKRTKTRIQPSITKNELSDELEVPYTKEPPVLKGNIRVIGYRYDATGVFGYEFYEDMKQICTVSGLVVPSPTIMISGFGRNWKSEFDVDSTLFPGLTRTILDDATNKEVGALTYDGNKSYRLCNSVKVSCTTECYSFYDNEGLVAQTTKFQDEEIWLPQALGFDYEVYFNTVFNRDINDETKMLIVSFPVLRFDF